MKMGLKIRLILSYTMLSLLLVLSLLVLSNILLERQFKDYMIKKQEEKNADYVSAILTEFESGKQLSEESFLALGQKALKEGIIIMILDNSDEEIFCMSCYDNNRCENMIGAMAQTMEERYPGFQGEYTEKRYPLTADQTSYGAVTLGFYGPYYLLEEDIRFMDVLNQLYLGFGFLFLFLAVLLGYIMASRISGPIEEVTRKTRQIEQGDSGSRIDLTSNTKEIQGLIDGVNALAASLETQQAVKKRMASDYAHEFRTPLAAIQSNLEGIIDGIFEADTKRLESIHTEILRLSRMVSQIGHIAELENKSSDLVKIRFDLRELLHVILSTFEAQMKQKEIQMEVQAVFCMITADRDKISSVITNLLSNAIKYTNHRGRIKISLWHEKNQVILLFEDSGIGIEKEDLPHIFEHLYRTDTSRTRETGGSGIGLAIVHAILAAHGGRIEVESEPGKGSIFTVILPE